MTRQICSQQLSVERGCNNHIDFIEQCFHLLNQDGPQSVRLHIFNRGDQSGCTEDVGPGLLYLAHQQIVLT